MKSTPCKLCKLNAPDVKFTVHTSRKPGRNQGRAYRAAYCNQCRGKLRRIVKLKHEYNLTPEAHEVLKAKQDFRCAICKELKERLDVDHDHQTGLVRGLLCFTCNVGIGMLKDDPVLVEAALKYLQDAKAVL